MTESNNSSETKLPIVGILGDGQLAMMMAQAYQALGGQVYIFGASAQSPAGTVANKVFVGNPNDFNDLEEFFNASDVVTLENEFNDSNVLSYASTETETLLYPDPKRFGLIEDKLSEKLFFQDLGIQQAEFFEVKSADDLLDQPGYLKLAKGGYDGIGTYRVNNEQEALEIYNTIKSAGVVLFEHAINFKKELSLIAVSDTEQMIFYPMVETHQEHGTCRYVTFPSGISNAVEQQAQAHVKLILDKLNTRGLFAFEFFLDANDQLILNESAPRPHNSGHITLDLADCNQFENHMRSVAGLPLIEPKLLEESMTMVNLLGTQNGPFDAQKITDSVSDSNTSITLYRKSDSRIKRKMGHINLWGAEQQQRAEHFVKSLDV